MELTLTLGDPGKRVQLFGAADVNLRTIREICNVQVSARDGRVKLFGSKAAVTGAAALLELMQEHLKNHGHITRKDILHLVNVAASSVRNNGEYCIEIYTRDRIIEPRTPGQVEYVKSIEHNDMVFCTGPAGTGKTYLAVAMAVSMLKRERIRRIILVRPAVEAGEKLGFLPGDMQAKVNPYLRPLFDALGDMMAYEQVKQFMQNDIIEVVPLAFMRGRTLNKAAVILDEAQNTTASQMLMFLTRMGYNSKMIITGDDSQSDLEKGKQSGLIDALHRLQGIKGISFVRLSRKDIVRHRLVQTIVRAYQDRDGRSDNTSSGSPEGNDTEPGDNCPGVMKDGHG